MKLVPRKSFTLGLLLTATVALTPCVAMSAAPSSSSTTIRAQLSKKCLRPLGFLDEKAVARVVRCLPAEGAATLWLDGPGGNVPDLFDLLGRLHDYRAHGHRITCIVTREADSANVFLFESPECDVRIMFVRARLGIHRVQVTAINLPAWWVVEHLKDTMAREHALLKMVADRIDKLGGTEDTIKTITDLVDGEPEGIWYVDGGLAVGIGLVDRVSGP
jgi:hypothetical protein